MQFWDQVGDETFKSLVGQTGDLFAGLIPEEESLTQMILEHLDTLDARVPRVVYRDTGFHPSELFEPCGRNEVLKRVLPKANDGKKFPGSLKLRFEVGHAVHKHWQGTLLGKMRILKGTWRCTRCTYRVKDTFMPSTPCPRCEWQVAPHPERPELYYPAEASKDSIGCGAVCSWPGNYEAPGRDCAFCERGGSWAFSESRVRVPELDIVGSIDGIVLRNVREHVLEMKTKDVFAWDNMRGPDDRHVFQIQIYMGALGVHWGIVAYINKNSGLMKEYEIQYDPSFLERARTHIGEVRQAMRAGVLPNGVCASIKDKRAKECPYSGECFTGLDEVAKLKEKFGAK